MNALRRALMAAIMLAVGAASVVAEDVPPPPVMVKTDQTAVTLTEGGTATYKVMTEDALLEGQTVTVTLALSTPSNQLTLTPTQLVLNSTNWQAGVDVTIAGVDDQVLESTAYFTIEHSVAYVGFPAMPGGNEYDSVDVAVTLLDDDISVAPTAVADAFAVALSSTTTTLNVLANDSDANAGQTLTITAVDDSTTNGTVAISGSAVVYTLPAGAVDNDVDTFTYTISDDLGLTATATVTITLREIVTHPADTNLNNIISLAELSAYYQGPAYIARYWQSGYYWDPAATDPSTGVATGYWAAGPKPDGIDPKYHAADTNQNGIISLAELSSYYQVPAYIARYWQVGYHWDPAAQDPSTGQNTGYWVQGMP